jgi:hypothetical protein
MTSAAVMLATAVAKAVAPAFEQACQAVATEGDD